MPLDFDPSGDLASVIDAVEPVSLRRAGRSQPIEVSHALRRALRTREVEASAGRYAARDAVWHLPAAEVGCLPKPGDVIVDAAGGRWVVLDLQQTSLASRWRCVTRNLAIVHGLDSVVHVERATYVKGQRGAERPTWHVWKTGLRARIQPVRAEAGLEHGRPVTRSHVVVFLADDLPLDHRCRIRGPDGALYRVTACRKADRIDALMEIDAITLKDPLQEHPT